MALDRVEFELVVKGGGAVEVLTKTSQAMTEVKAKTAGVREEMQRNAAAQAELAEMLRKTEAQLKAYQNALDSANPLAQASRENAEALEQEGAEMQKVLSAREAFEQGSRANVAALEAERAEIQELISALQDRAQAMQAEQQQAAAALQTYAQQQQAAATAAEQVATAEARLTAELKAVERDLRSAQKAYAEAGEGQEAFRAETLQNIASLQEMRGELRGQLDAIREQEKQQQEQQKQQQQQAEGLQAMSQAQQRATAALQEYAEAGKPAGEVAEQLTTIEARLSSELKVVERELRAAQKAFADAGEGKEDYRAEVLKNVESLQRLRTELRGQIDDVQQQQKALVGGGREMERATSAAFSLASGLSNAGRFGSSLESGIRGVASSAPGLIRNFARLRDETGSWTAAGRGLLGILTGPAGIAAAITALAAIAVTAGPQVWRLFSRAAEEAEEARERVQALLSSLLEVRRTQTRFSIGAEDLPSALEASQATLDNVKEILRVDRVIQGQGGLGIGEALLRAQAEAGQLADDIKAVVDAGGLSNEEREAYQARQRILEQNVSNYEDQIKVNETLIGTERELALTGADVAALRREVAQDLLTARERELALAEETRDTRLQELQQFGEDKDLQEGIEAAYRERVLAINKTYDERERRERERGGAEARRFRERLARQEADLRTSLQIETLYDEHKRELAAVQQRLKERQALVEQANEQGVIDAERAEALIIQAGIAANMQKERIERRYAERMFSEARRWRQAEGELEALRLQAAGETEDAILQARIERAEEEVRIARDSLGEESDAYREALNRRETLDAQLLIARRKRDEEEAKQAQRHADRMAELDERRARALGTSDREVLAARLERLRVEYAAAEENTERQMALAERLAQTEIELAEATARAFERRAQQVERYVGRVFRALEDIVRYEERYTDNDIALTERRFRDREEALRESLAEQKIDQEEFNLEMKRLQEDRAAFDKSVEADRASFLERSITALTDLVIEEGLRMLASFIARETTKLAFGTASTATATATQVAAANTIAAAYAPAAAAASIATFGAAAAAGGTAGVGAVSAIYAALGTNKLIAAFARGGVVGRDGEPVSGSPTRAATGYIGQPGARGRDSVHILAAEGEAILNGAQQEVVNRALLHTFGMDLGGLFSRVRTPHYLTPAPDLTALVSPPRLYAQGGFATAGGGGGVDALVDELRAVRAELGRQSFELRRITQANLDGADRISRSVGDPDNARRLVSTASARSRELNPRRGRL